MSVCMSDPIITRIRIPLGPGLRTNAEVFEYARTEGQIPRPGHCDCSICRADGDCCGCYVPSVIRLVAVCRRRKKATFKVRSTRNL